MAQPTTGDLFMWNGTEGVYSPFATAVPDASETVKGITLLSYPPASPTSPIAVGDNDPRMVDILHTGLNSAYIFVGSAANVATGNPLTLSVTPGSFSLGNSGILTMPNATTALRGLLSSTDWNTFNNKEPAITAGTTAQYWRGDKSFQTLDTLAVPENTNLYFTNARAIASTLTGYTSGAGVVSAADSILSAIEKINGNVDALVTGVSSVSGTTNRITASPTTGAVVVDIASTYAGQTSITTLGTITSGVWNGTAITNSYLANSTISGISLGSNLATLTIGAGLTGTSYNGSSAVTIAIDSTLSITDDTTTNATMYPAWVTANTGYLPIKVSSTKFSFNPSTGSVTTAGDAYINTVRVGLGVLGLANNTVVGTNSLAAIQAGGDYNSALGSNVLTSNTTGTNNTAMGPLSLYTNTTGTHNTGVGVQTLYLNLSGIRNTGVGLNAGYTNSTGNSNVYLGFQSGYYETGSSHLWIDNTARASLADGIVKSLVYGTFATTVAGQQLTVNGTLNVTGAGVIVGNSTTLGVVSVYGSTSGLVTVQPKAIAGTWTMTLPDSGGTNLYFLQTNGSGVTSWALPSTSASDITITDDTTTNATMYPTWVTANTGSLPLYVSSTKFSFNPSTGSITAAGDALINSLTIGQGLVDGLSNTGVGYQVLSSVTTGNTLIALGYQALKFNTTGIGNSGIGYLALGTNTDGNYNTAFGTNASKSNLSGGNNVSIGNNSLFTNSTGSANIAIGDSSLYSNTSNFNVGIGYEAGYNNLTGASNVFLGFRAGKNETGSNKLYISNSDTATPLIGGDFSTPLVTINGGLTVTGSTSLGTISAGTWNGSVISPVYGGTGIANNVASTLTISGAFATTVTVTAGTTVTLPVSGTLYGTLANSITALELYTSLATKTGTSVPVFNTSPTFTTDITTPLIIGGTAVGSNVTYKSTTGVGTAAGIAHQWTGGTNGGTTIATMLNNGRVGIGIAAPTDPLHVVGGATGGLFEGNPQGVIGLKLTGATTYSLLSNATGMVAFYRGSGSLHDFAVRTGAVGIGYSTATTTYNFSLGFGNQAARTFGIEATATDVIGRRLTISAGSTVAGTSVSDVTGGDVVINAGLGTGAGSSRIFFQAGTTLGSGTTLQTLATKMTILGNGNVGIGQTVPTAVLHLKAGTATANTAPIKLTSQAIGSVLTVAEAGAVEFSVDNYFLTSTTGTIRKTISDFAYRAITSLRTLDGSDELVNITSGTFTVTLPTAVGYTKQYTINNSGTGVITIATTSAQTISGTASGILTLIQYDNIVLRSDGADWIKIN